MADEQSTTETISRPKFPEHSGSWWHKKISELTDEQAEIKRTYYRNYNIWKNNRGEKPVKILKLPEGSSEWWNLPISHLSLEQAEIRRAYRRAQKESNNAYNRKYQKTRYNNDKEFREMCKNKSKMAVTNAVKKAVDEEQQRYEELMQKYDELLRLKVTDVAP